MIIIYQNNLDIVKDIVKKSSCDFCIILEMDHIILELLKSFSGGDLCETIYKQIDLDFPRIKVYLDDHKCSMKDYFEFCSKYSDHKCRYGLNLEKLLLLLATQASFFNLFSVMSDIFTDIPHNVYVFSTRTYPVIEIFQNDNTIDIVFRKELQQYDVTRESVNRLFQTYMVLSLDLTATPQWKYAAVYNINKSSS